MKLIFLIFVLKFNSILGIYDGIKAYPHQFPYVVLINNPRFYCSGTLISNKFVVTAAHCLMSVKSGKAIKVSLGVHEYYGNSISDGFLIESKKFWIHENFSMPSAVNDIGLIELPDPIEPSIFYKPIRIDKKNNTELNFNDNEIVLAGWGHFAPGQRSTQLRYTTMKLLIMTECLKFRYNYIETLTNNHICATKITNLPCDGDSGTALVTKKSGKIVGILSYVKDAENGIDMGRNDCKTNVPVVATRISSYIDWISEKSGLKF
ncbi:hypothetical protein PVAND_015796 [Polypedilum vanderplanki]|uniref:Peptidase S1 domain-containing protein n=1 Tax=Polypedilum vanderplanki TaxID=319348 RepID=A0A9J6BE88_POLVA|nr:hypothetical protein PVAND_015796 [Polypedilum vanderplanki]